MTKKILMIVVAGLTGCATTSGVMPGPNGTYTISAFAAPIRGGASGAYQTAYEDAQKHCAKSGKTAIVLNGQDRDVYQGASYAQGNMNANSAGLNANYSAGSGTFAAGNAKLTFRCDPPAAK
jgi:hypothetical protein